MANGTRWGRGRPGEGGGRGPNKTYDDNTLQDPINRLDVLKINWNQPQVPQVVLTTRLAARLTPGLTVTVGLQICHCLQTAPDPLTKLHCQRESYPGQMAFARH